MTIYSEMSKLSDMLTKLVKMSSTPRPYQTAPLSFMSGCLSTSGTFTLRLPRQSGKNWIMAKVLTEHLQEGSGDILLFSPSYRQTRINYRRLKDFGNTDISEGHIFHGADSNVYLFTGSPTAHIVGQTAEAALIIDEAQDIDEEVFTEKLIPMTASTNAPIILVGTANSDNENLLRRQIQMLPNERNFQITADDIQYPNYKEHVDQIVSQYGREAPFVKTQYYLEDLDSSTLLWFNPRDICTSASPENTNRYYMGIDLGAGHTTQKKKKPTADFTEIVIGKARGDKVYIIGRMSWRGVRWEVQQQRIEDLIKKYRPKSCIIDARGVGEQLAATLEYKYKAVVAYKASPASIASDCYLLGSFILNNRLNATEAIREVLIKQIDNGLWDIDGQNRVSVKKGSEKIDLLKATMYLLRGIPVKKTSVPTAFMHKVF